ncbi:MAG: ABC transporter permease [Candidatus Omnitrophota bacterium]
MLMLKLAFRNILRQKRRSLLTGLSMLGGFALAAFSIGWSDGSYKGVIDTFTRNQLGHIQIHHTDYLDRPAIYKTINNPAEIASLLIKDPLVTSWAPRIYSAGLASVGEKTVGVRIIGIDPIHESKTTHFNHKIIEGSMFKPHAGNEAIIGKGLAKLLQAHINDEAVIVSQGADGSMANDKYKITGIIDTGDEMNNRSAFYLPLAAAQELLVLPNRVHEIAITVKSLDDVQKVTESLTTTLKKRDPQLSIDPWQVFAKDFYVAMKTDEKGQWVMLFIIMLVVSVGVLNTVLMSVLERRREYGVLKAIGTKPGQIVRMVLLEVFILCLFCLAAGSVIALGLNYYVSIHGVKMPEPMSYGGMSFSLMKAEVNARSFYIPAITILISALAVSLFPAFKAAHTDPAKSMRRH